MSIVYGESIRSVVEQFARAPLEYPEILPTVLPLVLGVVIIELYFGKHDSETLGWNTSVGNAIIWIATGVSLLLTEELVPVEQKAVYSLIGLGVFVAYMDFYHKWSPSVAFEVSSAGVVYTLAYIIVVVIKTGMTIDQTLLKGAAVFFIGANLFFKIVQVFEPSANDRFQQFA